MINTYKNHNQSSQKSLKTSNGLKRARPNDKNNDEIDNIQISDNESYDEHNEQVKVKIGKVPYGWYDEFKHFGYDNNLEKVVKQKTGDQI